MSDLYTCITCRVAFTENESQRLHYKSDWHRYNLKRKVAELVPVTAVEFINRVNAQRNEINVANSDESKHCYTCRKHFNNANSYVNHLNSKKHKDHESSERVEIPDTVEENAQIIPEVNNDGQEELKSDSECEEVDSDEWEEENPVVNNVCLFCTHRSRSLVRNLRHMSNAHSFFIPDVEYCADVSALIIYLGEKVYEGFMCLWCNDTGRAFHSSEAAQGHMRDKGHCKMLHEGAVLAEYVTFYDYSTSYPADEQTPVDVDAEVDVSVLDGSDYQLVLPSGAVIGHRSLFRYYRQPVPSAGTAIALPQSRSSRTLRRVLAEYKSLGWLETKREQAAKNARDVRYMMRVQNKWATKLELKANKFQPHFRQQVNY